MVEIKEELQMLVDHLYWFKDSLAPYQSLLDIGLDDTGNQEDFIRTLERLQQAINKL
jgi:hypothetical protein